MTDEATRGAGKAEVRVGRVRVALDLTDDQAEQLDAAARVVSAADETAGAFARLWRALTKTEDDAR